MLFEYTIRPGDTLYSLASQFNVAIGAILSANPGLNPYNLIVGQVITIPTYNLPTQPVYPILPMPYRRNPGRGFMPGGPGLRRP